MNASTGDYDLAMPVDAAPVSPVTAAPGSPASDQYFIAEEVNPNANNNNSNSLVRPSNQAAALVEEEGYLAPAVSIKKPKKPTAKPSLSNTSKASFSQAVPPSQLQSKPRQPTVKPHSGSSVSKPHQRPSAPPPEPEGYLEPSELNTSPLNKPVTGRKSNDYTKPPRISTPSDVSLDIEKNITDGSTDFFGARSRLKPVDNKRPSAKEGPRNADSSYVEVF